MNKAIFLDRDGVINKPIIKNGKGFAPKNIKDFKIYPKAKNDVKKLKNRGYKIFVITNQPDISKKLLKKKDLNSMHKLIKNKLKVDKILYCPHNKNEKCNCRKPKIGMIKKAIKGLKIQLNKSYMIGDRLSDIKTGVKAGCKTIFINRNYSEPKPIQQDKTVKSLNEAVRYILKTN